MKAKINSAIITWEGLHLEWSVSDDGNRPVYTIKKLIQRQGQEADQALIARGRAEAKTDTDRVKATYKQGGRDVIMEIESLE